MAEPGWYNENSLRSYPLVVLDDPPIPPSLIVDFGGSAGNGFDPVDHDAHVQSVDRVGDVLTINVALAGQPGKLLSFRRHKDDQSWTTSFESTTLDDGSKWSGFLVTGPLDATLELLPGDGAIPCGVAVAFEPTLIEPTTGGGVNMIRVGNLDRSRVGGSISGIIPNGAGLTGDVKFVPGYNSRLVASRGERAITINGSVGGGAGELLNDPPIYAGESPPTGTTTLDGGLRCGEGVTTINGQVGPAITLKGGPGAAVYPDPLDAHGIVIEVGRDTAGRC